MNMKFTAPQWGVVAGLMALCVLMTWYETRSDSRRRVAEQIDQPVAALLEENSRLVESIKKAEGVDSEGEILSAYLAMIRKDGVPKHSDIRAMIDHLVNNNTAILTLLDVPSDRDNGEKFRLAAAQFAEYATTVRDRWQSLFELFMAGGNLPLQTLTSPAQIREIVDGETPSR